MSYSTFTLLRQTAIPSLNLTVEEYQHLVTKAKHFHLRADDNNNAFLVALLTVPKDSTGVAHILEHTTLCGSKHYSVRDPFFMMTRRSLNTFMNAFTSSDWTAYPFASQNIKDFDNLLRVYLDAVFFPNLHELDFAQEGHRVEFEQADDPTTPLVYKGVVFNEMKGSMSAAVNRLGQEVSSHLFPTITYHYNSGGEPLAIPNLTHAQLQAFHASHYHPSNAIFMTYGNRSAREHQQLFEECALKHFQALSLNLHIPNEQRYTEPKQVVTYYPLDEQENLSNKTHIVVAWLLGTTTEPYEVMKVGLLVDILLDNSASPLRHALETTTLGTAPSPLCGLDTNTREASFVCGLEGSNPESASAVETLIFEVLHEVAAHGVSATQVESALHQIELSQREITGDHFPYGLQLLMRVINPIIHGGDPLPFLDIDAALNQLRQDCKNPQFIPNLVRQLLLENPHRVLITMVPDPKEASRQLAAEREQLAKLQASLTETDKAKILQQTTALTARQQQLDNPDLLPKVTLQDIPNELKIPEGTSRPINAMPATWFARSTNGLVYQYIVLDLPHLESELLDLLPIFCDCLTEVGCGKKNYLQMAELQAAVTGGIYAKLSLRGSLTDVQTLQSIFALSGKALVRNQAALTDLLKTTLEEARFDELPRLRELIAQFRADVENSITQRGHQLVMSAASKGLSPSGYLNHRWYGLEGLQHLKHLDESFNDEKQLALFAEKLTTIRHHLLAAPHQLLIISEAESQAAIADTLTQLTWLTTDTSYTPFKPAPINAIVKEAWSTHTQVNFCAKTYPTVAAGQRDAPALMVLGEFLRNGYLHRAIREQGGAYGGGASYDGDTGAFRFYSYRDPRLMETLTDFDNSLIWLQNTSHEPRALEEAILGIISRIDRPGSPAGEATPAFFNQLHGRTPKQRREFRQRVLHITIEDLQRVAMTYLQAERANVALLSDAKRLALLPKELERRMV